MGLGQQHGHRAGADGGLYHLGRGFDPCLQLPSFILAAGATVTVHTGTGTNTATDLYWGLGSSVRNNAGDTATFKAPDGTVISSLSKP